MAESKKPADGPPPAVTSIYPPGAQAPVPAASGESDSPLTPKQWALLGGFACFCGGAGVAWGLHQGRAQVRLMDDESGRSKAAVTDANRKFAMRQTFRALGYATVICGLGGVAITSLAAYKLDVKSVPEFSRKMREIVPGAAGRVAKPEEIKGTMERIDKWWQGTTLGVWLKGNTARAVKEADAKQTPAEQEKELEAFAKEAETFLGGVTGSTAAPSTSAAAAAAVAAASDAAAAASASAKPKGS